MLHRTWSPSGRAAASSDPFAPALIRVVRRLRKRLDAVNSVRAYMVGLIFAVLLPAMGFSDGDGAAVGAART